ncbi:MAG: Hsp70 family protein [Planctomycetes bacterium]|nr:Hsp70 family protein [Planctomycetota bacterium]
MNRPVKSRIDGIGIDFGTTNSVVATAVNMTEKMLTTPLLADSRPHPSVVWYRASEGPTVGRRAKEQIHGYSDAPGNLFFSSIKRHLGKEREFSIFGKKHPARDIAAEIFRYLKQDAKTRHHVELEHAVVTIPVEFDGRARRDLRRAANQAGIHIRTFVHEPFAAIVGYCLSDRQPKSLEARDSEKILVFDWGGGTLDITVGEIAGGMITELATSGTRERSGDHFDEILGNFSRSLFLDRHQLNVEELGLSPSIRDRMNVESELRKIDLSTAESVYFGLKSFCRVNERSYDLYEQVTRSQFNSLIESDVKDAIHKVDETLVRAGLNPSDIDVALLIGGTSRIPLIRQEMFDRFGTRMVEVPNADSIIAEGAAIVAALNMHPVLAAPISLELSDETNHPVFDSGAIAKPEACQRQVSLFCTDNRDGMARLIVKEGARRNNQQYTTKGIVAVPVNSELPKPYDHERVTARFTIDEDLILRVAGHAATQRRGAEMEVYDLRFALKYFAK